MTNDTFDMSCHFLGVVYIHSTHNNSQLQEILRRQTATRL